MECLALLLVLQRKVEKEKEKEEAYELATWSTLGVPKNNFLKRAFRKLWEIYENPLKLHLDAERNAANVVHRTP
jgi:hypothetical protein